MKIIIEAYGAVISEFDPAEVDSIRVFRNFDIAQAAKSEAPFVTYIRHFDYPLAKSGRILAVYLHKKATFHLYDPDNCCVTFK